jgi:hypothetical protein
MQSTVCIELFAYTDYSENTSLHIEEIQKKKLVKKSHACVLLFVGLWVRSLGRPLVVSSWW